MSLIHTETPTELFGELVAEAMDHQKVRSSPGSAEYLVQLLDGFVRPRQLYSHAEIAPDRPLAEIFLTAVSADGMRRFTLLKLSGDLALFICGVFSDSVRNQPVDVDYYGKLGGCAYSTVAGSCRSPEGATLFEELATNFGRFVDVLNEVSESCGLTDSDMLRLYEKWMLSGSRRDAETLARSGVVMTRGSDEIH
ncbi:MAG: hypothetical protein GY719_11650 [bacterium]|nr:hypothetical protein [bacterium]